MIEFYIFLYGDWPGFLSQDVGIPGKRSIWFWSKEVIQVRKLSLFFILGRSENFRNIGLLEIEIWYAQKSRVETGSTSTRRAHSCLTNFYATGYHHLGAGSNDTSAREFSQAHPADLLNIPKLTYIFRNNHRIKILKTPFESL